MKLEELKKSLSELIGKDFLKAERAARNLGDVMPLITFSTGFQVRLAALALKVDVEEIERLPLNKYSNVANTVSNFLFSGESDTEKLKESLNRLTGHDFIAAEKEVRSSGDVMPLITFSTAFQVKLAARALNIKSEEIENKAINEYASIATTVSNYLFAESGSYADVEKLKNNLMELTGKDFLDAEKDARSVGEVMPLISFSTEFQIRLASRALKTNPRELESLPISEYASIATTISNFLFSGNDTETEDSSHETQ